MLPFIARRDDAGNLEKENLTIFQFNFNIKHSIFFLKAKCGILLLNKRLQLVRIS